MVISVGTHALIQIELLDHERIVRHQVFYMYSCTCKWRVDIEVYVQKYTLL